MRNKVLKAVSNDETSTPNFHTLNLSPHDQFVSLSSAQSKESCRLFNGEQKAGIKSNNRVYCSISHCFSLSSQGFRYRATRRAFATALGRNARSSLRSPLVIERLPGFITNDARGVGILLHNQHDVAIQ